MKPRPSDYDPVSVDCTSASWVLRPSDVRSRVELSATLNPETGELTLEIWERRTADTPPRAQLPYVRVLVARDPAALLIDELRDRLERGEAVDVARTETIDPSGFARGILLPLAGGGGKRMISVDDEEPDG